MKKENQMFRQMKLMKKVVTFMEEERILSNRRAETLRNDIRRWWVIKSHQIDKMRDDAVSLEGGNNGK